MKLIKILFIIFFAGLVSCGVSGDPTRPDGSAEVSS